MGLPFDAYYVLTKAEPRLANAKTHPNTGSPDYNVSHAILDITGLQTALDSKTNTGHTHVVSDISNIDPLSLSSYISPNATTLSTLDFTYTISEFKFLASPNLALHTASPSTYTGATLGESRRPQLSDPTLTNPLQESADLYDYFSCQIKLVIPTDIWDLEKIKKLVVTITGSNDIPSNVRLSIWDHLIEEWRDDFDDATSTKTTITRTYVDLGDFQDYVNENGEIYLLYRTLSAAASGDPRFIYIYYPNVQHALDSEITEGKWLGNAYVLGELKVEHRTIFEDDVYAKQNIIFPTLKGEITNGLFWDPTGQELTLSAQLVKIVAVGGFLDFTGVDGVLFRTLLSDADQTNSIVTSEFGGIDITFLTHFNVFSLIDGQNIIGMESNPPKLGFFATTPVSQPATVDDAETQNLTGEDTINKAKTEADLTSCKNAINAVIDRLQEIGLIG